MRKKKQLICDADVAIEHVADEVGSAMNSALADIFPNISWSQNKPMLNSAVYAVQAAAEKEIKKLLGR